MKTKTLMVITFGVLFSTIGGCTESNRNDVVVIEKTGMYHRNQCPPVRMARSTIMREREAQEKHFKPCPACRTTL